MSVPGSNTTSSIFGFGLILGSEGHKKYCFSLEFGLFLTKKNLDRYELRENFVRILTIYVKTLCVVPT